VTTQALHQLLHLRYMHLTDTFIQSDLQSVWLIW